MRRLPPALVAACIATATLGLLHDPAAAQDVPPPGAKDGIPVGAEPDPVPEGADPPAPAPAPAAAGDGGFTTAATPPERYFSEGAYRDIEAAVSAAPRPCAVSDNGLKALVLAPIFFESSGALTASSAPSPMTLSRYDEWNPAYHPTLSNLGANRSLYAQRDPYTAYPRVYWHPGIGIWQYDSAGLGAPFTAVERMDARVIAPTVASRILTRYCNAKAAGQSDLNARKASWADWVGCASSGCEQVFQELAQNSFSQMRLLSGIDRLGGTELRTCSLPGRGQFACAYVDHTKAQGARWWAVNSTPVPINDGDPTDPPAPLSTPFYVFELDGKEHRHWLSADSGYPASFSATRTLGRNARYRTDQAGSGLTWSSSSSLCDVSATRGACVPTAPAGISSAPIAVGGSYRALSLDVDGDGRGDVLWYAPGPAADSLWLGQGGGSFSSVPTSISSDYDDVLTGDFTGDGRDDVVWYKRSSGQAFLWRSLGDGAFASVSLYPGAQRHPLALDVDGDDDLELFWYGPGGLSDRLWDWHGGASGGFLATAQPVNGVYQPFVGDFDGNGRDDIFWYAPGPGPDPVWLHRIAGGHTDVTRPVGGTYQPLVGDLDGDGADDILWYGAGTAADSLWFGGPGGSFTNVLAAINGHYDPVMVDLEGDGRDDLIWYAPGPSPDAWWRWSSGRAVSSVGLQLPRYHQAVVGAFSAGGDDGVLWHEAGPTPDVVWYR